MTRHGSRIDPSWNGGTSPYPSDAGLHALFARRVRERPEAPAIDAGDVVVSYAELDRMAARMAHALRARGVARETPVGVFMGPRPQQIVAQLAILKAGGTYVPLDPDYPRERLEFMIADAAIRVVVCDDRAHGLDVAGAAELSFERDAAELAAAPEAFPAVDAGPEHRTHVLYTSGSTGRPKGIELLARGVARLVCDTDYIRFAPGDRVAQIANFSFDAATFEVWGALLAGATLVPIPRQSALDPPLLRDELRARRVDVLLLTTALFNLVAQTCPDAFATVRELLIGGERANLHAVREVLAAAPPGRLINAYGPTEATVIATTCDLDAARVAEGVAPIGRPIANTVVHVLDDAQRPVGVGEPGEIYIGGDGLARGYLRRPALTAEKFVHVAGLAPGRELRLYRTGDLARWRPDGALEFLGRADFQVKIRGVRVEIEEVEAALLATELLNDAAVAPQSGAHGETLLVAHVVPRDPVSFRVPDVQARLQDALPRAMIPAKFVVVEALPLNANGKVDRKALALGTTQSGVFSLSALRAAHDPLTAELAALWADLLGVDEVRPDDDFFALGGDSILAARLVLRVRDAWQVPLPIYALYESGTLRACATLVRDALRGAASTTPSPDGPDVWQADARLPADVKALVEAAAASAPPASDWRHGNAFVTGATGFLGAFLVADLLQHTDVRVHCLVRAADAAEGAGRLLDALAKHGLWQDGFASRLHVVVGDLQRRRFGLDAEAFEALASVIDVVFHAAAHVHYVQPYVAHRPANVVGTVEVIRLAATARAKPLHHVSTVAVFGPSGFFGGKPRIGEDDDPAEHLQYLPYDIGYSASKWVSEQLVWAAIRAGLPAAVHRPGFIMGDSRTGAGNPDDFVGRCIRGSIRVGAYPDLPRQRKEFVPVDYVSRAILHIAAQPSNLGRAYHLVPPDPRQSIELEEFFELIAASGYALERVAYADWVELIVGDACGGGSPLCPLLPMLLERVHAGGRTRWQLHEGMPIYDASRTARALAGSGVVFRPLDRGLMATYLRRLVADGHIPLVRPPDAAEVRRTG